MTVFDLLLDYVANTDPHLKARDYGFLLSSLVVDRQSRLFLAGKLLKAKEDWRKQKGFQKYLDREQSSLLERLSLSPGRGVTKPHRMEAITREVTATFNDAYDYARRFSPMPQQVAPYIRGDYIYAVRWMTTWAVFQRALNDNAGERYVKYVRTELRHVQSDLRTVCFNVCRRHEVLPEASELARGFAESLICRARHCETIALN